MKTKEGFVRSILCVLFMGLTAVTFARISRLNDSYIPFHIDFFGKERSHQYPIEQSPLLQTIQKAEDGDQRKTDNDLSNGFAVQVQVLDTNQRVPDTDETYLLRFYIVEVPVKGSPINPVESIALRFYRNNGEIVFEDEWHLSELLDGPVAEQRQNQSELQPEADFPYAGPMVLVKAGDFRMGDEYGDLFEDCKPLHPVTLTYDYYIGKTEVTFDAYDDYCRETGKEKPLSYRVEYNEGEWIRGQDMGRGSRPVIHVSWNDAAAYCNWLSESEGLAKAYDTEGKLQDSRGKPTTDITQVQGYRLPTEAEWEYAARGGHKSTQDYPFAGHTEISAVGWYVHNSGEIKFTEIWEPAFVEQLNMKTREVGLKTPNELGLYDMSGNVWEWCHDGYGSYTVERQVNPIGLELASVKVLRGGSWYAYADYCRVANRNHSQMDNKSFGIGFRVVRTVF